MPVYPVAYRAAAIAIEQGFQLPRLPNAPLPVIAFMLGFYATWKALDYFDPEGAKKLEALDPVFGLDIPQDEDTSTYARVRAWTLNTNYADCSQPPAGIPPWTSLTPLGFRSCWGTCNTAYPIDNCPPAVIKRSTIDAFMVAYAGTSPVSGIVYIAPWRVYHTTEYIAPGNPGADDPAFPLGVIIPLDPAAVQGAVGRPLPEYYPNAWALPVGGFGEVANPPRPFPVPGVSLPGSVAPGVVPGVVPEVVPGVGTGVGAGVGVGEIARPLPLPSVLVPVGGSVAAFPAQPFGQNHFPPGKGKAEVKMRGKAAKGIRWLANFLTESKDFIEALWKALPKDMRSKCKGPRGGKAKCTVQEMLADLYKAREYMFNNEGYVKRAVVEVIVNEIGDNFYGRAGKKFKAAGDKLRELGYWNDRPAGWQTGNRYRPRPKTPGAHTDYVHDWVESAVNFVW